jgi:hypothetical protein
MSDKHTPEPWKIPEPTDPMTCVCTDGANVALCVRKEDARRIIACVNACAGMSTDVLERENIKHVLEKVFWSAPECKCSFGREATSDQSYRCAWCVVEDYVFSMTNDTESETE